MDAISVSNGTKYACNLKSETDHLYLQYLSIGTIYACNHRKCHSHVIQGRFSTLQAYMILNERDCVSDLRLQTYLAPFETDIASILGPLCYQHCNHI